MLQSVQGRTCRLGIDWTEEMGAETVSTLNLAQLQGPRRSYGFLVPHTRPAIQGRQVPESLSRREHMEAPCY